MVNNLVLRWPKPFFFMALAAHAACLICVHGKCRLINILYVYGLNGNVGNEWYLTGKRRLINVPFIGSYEKYIVHMIKYSVCVYKRFVQKDAKLTPNHDSHIDVITQLGMKTMFSTLPKTNSSPMNIGNPKRNQSYSNHPFSGAMLNFQGG